ncbi:MAG: hypothetical protein QOI53_2299, partial [Verrucomicrobiota bacterium]|nr:hypothetical protein [Verrucomicrobiota bacterium]
MVAFGLPLKVAREWRHAKEGFSFAQGGLILAPLQHLQPGEPGVFPTRRDKVA